jgi:hypothetical protein
LIIQEMDIKSNEKQLLIKSSTHTLNIVYN